MTVTVEVNDDAPFDYPGVKVSPQRQPRYDGRPSNWQNVWKVVAITMAVMVGIAGLALLALIILLVAAFNGQGSNK